MSPPWIISSAIFELLLSVIVFIWVPIQAIILSVTGASSGISPYLSNWLFTLSIILPYSVYWKVKFSFIFSSPTFFKTYEIESIPIFAALLISFKIVKLIFSSFPLLKFSSIKSVLSNFIILFTKKEKICIFRKRLWLYIFFSVPELYIEILLFLIYTSTEIKFNYKRLKKRKLEVLNLICTRRENEKNYGKC